MKANSSSESEHGEYVVEKILDKKIVGNKIFYFIKWSGYDDPEENTWEPAENCDCHELIKKFEEGQQKSLKKTPSKRSKKSDLSSGGKIKTAKMDKKKDDELVIDKDDPMLQNKEDDAAQVKEVEASAPKPLDYGILRGEAIQTIVGVQKEQGNLMALLKYVNGKHDYVPTSIIGDVAPKNLLSFYEARLRFLPDEKMK